MSQANLVSANGHICGVHDWTEGFTALKCRRKEPTEDDVLAFALWLENRGLEEAVEDILERYLAGYRL